MKYRLSLSLIVATSLVLSTTVAYAQEDNGKQTTAKDKKENTSKPIDFDKAQKMSPQALKDQLTPEDLRLHNKVAEHNANSVEMRTFANRSYQDVNTYIANNNIKPAKIVQDSRMNNLPKYNYKSGKFIGVVIHETANPNSTIEGEVNYMYNNYQSAFVHAYASSDKIIQTAPSNYLAWGAGANANPYFYQIELTRSNTFDGFAKSVNNQAYLAAKMLKQNGLAPSLADNNQGTGTIISHNAISQYWGGTDHTDPVGYFNQWGYNMDQFYSLVQKHYKALSGGGNDDAITGSTYKVAKGDTLYSISRRSGVAIDDIKKWNNLSNNTLSVGQTLNLKAPSNSDTITGDTHKVVAGDTLYNISKRSNVSVENIKKWNNLKNDSISKGQTLYLVKTYTVKKGDTLYSIAKNQKTTVDKIKSDNKLDSNSIKVGQILKIK
ncbi:LysM peptidoglycan-binding domain-containing protein [Staphylococcus pseudoxylosus]|uniref:peptidoglycan recognition protein family protein n=1 Tax=Staphylococcus pseudoxylosus TaxID=2282419 RepID=UPI000D1D282B|nr:N-acetylmuramoyl-L-alanine amidase [Staphylococcus pseudoxylosus]PTI44695.1 amidase [Staphylococcus xylosus]MDW8797280.1 LysM peptidoglycan-binding domain-containing protein [Staphylococcus pseudoxylosus]MEB6036309.1 LysM peptidoglycan-binding domain-containing protein [Staphylococcus pseudoxylosus]MEB6044607.1 LysM peptidoglycan-binding domain-containing protein [Staphylococcus pseudoxylosus]MEB7754326.1 LysM peptidoglycan-binding domain-containing protein [Staphylococcus pseudoxylosus]